MSAGLSWSGAVQRCKSCGSLQRKFKRYSVVCTAYYATTEVDQQGFA